MNTNTGEIRKFASEDEARRAGFNLQLTAEQAQELSGLTHEERLNWYQRQVKALAREAEEAPSGRSRTTRFKRRRRVSR